jgi:general secretion pathway protein A
MYAQYYGLSESPFALTPDPRYLYLSEAHREALASATYGVQERKGFVLILGEVGTGKTTLIRHLLGRFGPDIRTVFVFNPAVSFLELLQLILRDLELPCPSVRRVEMIETLNEFLLKEATAGRYVVLIIDEAQHLSPTVLEEVRMLSNLETARGKLIQILLVGQPELGEKLGRPELRQLRQRIGLVAELKPLSYAETVRYVAHRLEVAGRESQDVFTRRALGIIYRASGGIPRLVNVICDKALLLGYGSSSRRIGGGLIKEVLKDWAPFRRRSAAMTARARGRVGSPHGVHSWKPFWRIATIAAVGLAATAFYLVLAGQRDGQLMNRLRRAVASERVSRAGGETPPAPAATLPPRPLAPVQSAPEAITKTNDNPQLAPPTVDPKPSPSAVAEPLSATRQPSPDVAPPMDPGGPREVTVSQGDVLSGLVARRYGRADLTLLDFVKAANPNLPSIDVLQPGQRLKLPALDPQAMVLDAGDGSGFRLHLLTVWDAQGPSFRDLRSAVERRGRRVYVTPVTLTANDTAYRVTVGNFSSRRDAEAFSRSFRFPATMTTQLWR